MEENIKGTGGQDGRNTTNNDNRKPEETIDPKGGKKVVPNTTDPNGVNTDGIPGKEDIDSKINDADDLDKDTTRRF